MFVFFRRLISYTELYNALLKIFTVNREIVRCIYPFPGSRCSTNFHASGNCEPFGFRHELTKGKQISKTNKR